MHGKEEYWTPFSDYLQSFASFGAQPPSLYPPVRSVLHAPHGSGDWEGQEQDLEDELEHRIGEGGFRVAVMLTSDEKYLAPVRSVLNDCAR